MSQYRQRPVINALHGVRLYAPALKVMPERPGQVLLPAHRNNIAAAGMNCDMTGRLSVLGCCVMYITLHQQRPGYNYRQQQ